MPEKIFVLIGVMGSGKDTILSKVLQYNDKLCPIISTTTRPPREGEKEGVAYHFVDDNQFKYWNIHKQFIETRVYHTVNKGKADIWYYGVHKSAVANEDYYITILDTNGVKEFQEYFGTDIIVPIYIDIDETTQLIRAKNRGDEAEEVARRIATDKPKFDKFKEEEEYYLVDNNSSLENAISEVLAIIEREMVRSGE